MSKNALIGRLNVLKKEFSEENLEKFLADEEISAHYAKSLPHQDPLLPLGSCRSEIAPNTCRQ